MNAKIMTPVIGAVILTVAGIGGYYWLRTDPAAPIVKNDNNPKEPEPEKKAPPDNINKGTPTVKPQPVAYEPAPVSLDEATKFLHTGPNPVQVGLQEVLDARRVAALRGTVFKDEAEPFPSVNVLIQHQPRYGIGYSRPDGSYDMVVNGGGLMSVGFKHADYLPVWRQATVPWQDYVWLPPVVMTKVDAKLTEVKSDAKGMQTARGSKVKDKDGERQGTLIFQGSTKATMELPDGKKTPLEKLSIRVTEYSVGKKGPDRMPAPLPAHCAYAYCFELSADEAVKAGAKTVRFDKPAVHYVENFLNFPIGTTVPAGYFDSAKAAWVASESGLVIKVLDIKNGLADLDVDGKGKPADDKTLSALKINADERRELARLYAAGTSLWRVPIPHFSIWGLNWGFSPPADAVPPRLAPPSQNVPDGKQKPAREALDIPGLAWKLNHDNERVPGAAAARTIRIPVAGKTLPRSVKRIDVEIFIAGQRIDVELPANPDQVHVFTWDGKDGFGRPMQTAPTARVRIGYVYDGVYQATTVFGASGNGAAIPGSRTRREVVLWQEHQLVLTFFDARAFGLGGWSFDVQHAYDPGSRTLYLGNGVRSTPGVSGAETANLVITTVAGGGKNQALGDGGPALQARLDNPMDSGGAGTYTGPRYAYYPRGLAVGADGTLFVADANNRIRRVDRDGTIRTIAGGGMKDAETGPATGIRLYNPRCLALGPDGSLYIGECYDRHSIRRLHPDGSLTTIAGGKTGGNGGDGGPASSAKLFDPTGIVVAPDGTLYFADQGNHRIRRITPDGIISTIAGTGAEPHTTALCGSIADGIISTTGGYEGDNGPAVKARLHWPTSLALAPDGSVYFSDQGNYVVRRISSSGMITTVAGVYRSEWSTEFSGDDGPTLQAKFTDPTGLAVSADGSVYIADTRNHRIRCVGPDGVIRLFAGAKTAAHGDFGGDQGPARSAKLSYPTALAFGPDGSLYFYDGSFQRGSAGQVRQRIRRIAPPLPGFSNTEIAVSSPDGKEWFKFNAVGQHLETLDAANKQVRIRLDYDKAGRLSKIEDVQSKTGISIQRDDKGKLRAIVAPQDRKIAAQFDAGGYLETLTSPEGELARMTYSDEGLLEKLTRSPQQESKVSQPKSPAQGTWQVLESGSKDDLLSVAFVSDQVGVAVGVKNTILRTIDGGNTWKRIMGPDKDGDDLHSVVFGNDKLGYTHGSYTHGLFRTNDAGATWEPFVNPNPSGLYSIKGFATHAARGNSYFWMNYAGTFSSLALYRTDDAKNWTKLWDHQNQTLGGSGARMVFTDALDGWMASTTHPGAKMWVGRSSDGGKTWTAQEIKDKVRGGYMLIHAVNKDVGWFCSEFSNHIHASTDSGKTWSVHDLGNGSDDTVRALQFVDVKTGYVLCGASWHVRRTTDGGKSWTALGALKAPAGVHGMHFTPAGVGFVVGAKGYIARYQP